MTMEWAETFVLGLLYDEEADIIHTFPVDRAWVVRMRDRSPAHDRISVVVGGTTELPTYVMLRHPRGVNFGHVAYTGVGFEIDLEDR